MILAADSLPPTASEPPTLDPSPSLINKPLESVTMSSAGSPQVIQTGIAIAVQDPSPAEETETKAEDNTSSLTDESVEPSPYANEPKSNFIITLNPSTTSEELDEYEKQLKKQGGVIKHKYDSIILKGFAVSLPESRIQSLSEDRNVQYVEPDSDVHI